MLLLATIAVSEAQQRSGKIAHIGFLGTDRSPSTMPREKAFLQGLRELGWIEGQNLMIERKYWENQAERLPSLADELVRQKLNIIVTTSGTAAWAVKKVTNIIPIVMVTSADAVTQGLVASLARPGGKRHRVNQYLYGCDREATRSPQRSFPESLTGGCSVLSCIRRTDSRKPME